MNTVFEQQNDLVEAIRAADDWMNRACQGLVHQADIAHWFEEQIRKYALDDPERDRCLETLRKLRQATQCAAVHCPRPDHLLVLHRAEIGR